MLEQYQKVLVTGGCGFIGGHLSRELLSLGKDVTVFDNLSCGTEANLVGGAKLVHGDLRNPDDVTAVLKGVELVFHLGANANGSISVNDPRFDFHVNALGTVNVLAAAVEAEVKKMVYISSAAVYGNPRTCPLKEDDPTEPFLPYGASKLSSEVAAKVFHRTYALPVVIARPMAVYGPGENPELAMVEISRYLRWHLNGEPIHIIGDPDSKTRDFVHVSDIVQGLLLLADRGVPGEAYNVASGTEVSMRGLADIIGQVTGTPATIDTITAITQDTFRFVADISKITALGYEPKTPLTEGVRQLAQALGDRPALPGSETIFTPNQRGTSR